MHLRNNPIEDLSFIRREIISIIVISMEILVGFKAMKKFFMTVIRFTNAIFMVVLLCPKLYLFLSLFVSLSICFVLYATIRYNQLSISTINIKKDGTPQLVICLICSLYGRQFYYFYVLLDRVISIRIHAIFFEHYFNSKS